MVAEDKFFAAQHVRVFRKKMPYWTVYMMIANVIAMMMFISGSVYAPFCINKYDHGIMMEYCG